MEKSFNKAKLIKIGKALNTRLNNKILHTDIGGLAIQLTNKTGAPSIKGSVVSASTLNDMSIVLQSTELDSIGVVLESGIADGGLCWVVIQGIAEVLLKDNTAATRGNWVIAADTDGRANATQPTPQPNNTLSEHTTHFKEIGHCVESIVAGENKLAKVVLHFN